MLQKNFLSTFLFSLIITLSVASAERCSNIGFFRPNSTYDKNRRLVLSSLASKVSAQDSFYNASIGQDPDRVYVQGMCIPGVEQEICSSCIKKASDQLLQKCTNQTEGYAWPAPGERTLCLVRYSNRPIFGTFYLEPSKKLHNIGNITSNLTKFDEIWGDLTRRMIETTSSSKPKYYVAEEAPVTSYDENIYAFMLCTPDLSKKDCKTCLQASVDDYKSCCLGKQGGAVTRLSCFFRWDLYPYFRVFGNSTFPSPPQASPTPSNQSTTAGKDRRNSSTGTIVAIVVPTVIIISVLLALGCYIYRRKMSYQAIEGEADAPSPLTFDLSILKAATNDFSEENKLGEGGFGPVYKGMLPNGQEIAVKRLSKHSGQGEQEFKNEVMLLSGLRHKNLVKLLGFCFKGNERLLIYEFLPNSSLDLLIFDSVKCSQATWSIRYSIIGGIARGLLYLHEDSRLRIIHRDLKPSNILLEDEMNPKISDFGIARFFSADETQANTSRVMGTYGYMAPEYIKRGLFSFKSDVYSFGIMVLEIISGQKNGSCQPSGLPSYAWVKWRAGQALDIVDPVIRNGLKSEIIRCIHIGLLCVQEDLAKRPTMNSVTLWLTSSTISLPVPTAPAFFMHNTSEQETSSSFQSEPGTANMGTGEKNCSSSLNEVSITELEPR